MNYSFSKLTTRDHTRPIGTRTWSGPLRITWGILLLLSMISVRVNAQTAPASITVAGACLGGTYVLDKVTDNYENTGRPGYLGSGTVTINGMMYADVGIAIFYEPAGPAWVMAFDGQSYQSNPATSTLPPTVGWVVDNSGGIGSCTGSAPLNVATGSVRITAPAVTTVCVGSPVSLTATTTNIASPITYTWRSSPTGFSGSGAVFTQNAPSVNAITTYVITVTATSGTSSATASTGITVKPTPTLTVGAATNATTCGGATGSIAFTSTNVPNGTYSLSYTGAGSPRTVTVTSNAFSLTGLAAGTYSNFSITVNGCVGSVATARTVGNPPSPTANLSSSGPLSCTAPSVTLTASGGTSYLFSSGATQISGGNTATVSTAGVYSVTVVAANACTGTASVTVTGSTTPTPVNLTASSPLSCSVTLVTLTATSGFTSYRFSAGATQQGGPASNTATASSAGVYSVTAINASACSSTATVTVSQGPDLTPVLYVRPSTAYGTTNMTVVVDVVELNGVATAGLLTVRLTKDASVTLSPPASVTTVNGRPVQNSLWTFDASQPNVYVLTTSQPIAAGGKLSFGLTGVLTPNATSGMFTLTAVIPTGPVCETKLTNNNDADKIEYFQQ